MTNSRLSEYYKTRKYRGFRKLQESEDTSSANKVMIFSNGKQVVRAWGRYNEEMLERIFDQIDRYYELKLARDPIKRIKLPSNLDGYSFIRSVTKPK